MPRYRGPRNALVTESLRFASTDVLWFFFGAWANHCAFYPGSAATLKSFRNELGNFQTSKGTIRFSPEKPLPVALVKKLVKTRIAENNDRANKARRKP